MFNDHIDEHTNESVEPNHADAHTIQKLVRIRQKQPYYWYAYLGIKMPADLIRSILYK
jgi:hypothetical protein